MSKKKLNIAQIHWGFIPIIGGVETHLSILMPELVKRGHNVSLLTGSAEQEKGRYKYHGVEIHRSPLFDLNWLYQRGLDGLEEEINQLYNSFFAEAKPDIVHTHNMHYFSKIHITLLEKLCKKRNIPLILTAHNVWDDILFLKLTREINWSHIIAVSHYIEKELFGIGCDDKKTTVIHHGIDIETFHPQTKLSDVYKKHPLLKGKKIVFHPARMGMAKGCDVSIKAINLVKNQFPDVLLVLAGTKNIIDWGENQQKEIAYFIDLVKTFKLEKNVYINAFSLKEMPELYNVAQVCIYPSSCSEPFGLTMLETLASEKPLIVTNSGGMPEIVKDGICGYVIPVKDFETLAGRISMLLANNDLRERLGRCGRQTVKNNYTKEIMTNRHLDIYCQVLSENA
ncbi:glycosyltransferase family 4 protein [bacterium]|nr:glycosyltransferase family 4 protein [bacterium]